MGSTRRILTATAIGATFLIPGLPFLVAYGLRKFRQRDGLADVVALDDYRSREDVVTRQAA